MKKSLFIGWGLVILASTLVGFGTTQAITCTNVFPTSLNNYVSGNCIPSAWSNALEAKIGIDNSADTSSLDYRITNLNRITSLNGSTSSTQTFATSGPVLSISTLNGVHTFSLPTSTISQTGVLTGNDWGIFNSKLSTSTIASYNLNGVTSTNITVGSTLTVGTLNGVLKGTTGVIGTASNGTDYTLISTNTCSAGQHVSSVSANGTVACSNDSFSSSTPTKVTFTDSNAKLYGEKSLCGGSMMFQYTTSTDNSFPDDCFVGSTSTIDRIQAKNISNGDSIVWNVFYSNGATAIPATTTGMFPIFSSNQTTNSTSTTNYIPNASSTPNADDFIRIWVYTASSTTKGEFNINIIGKDR